jgi:hypothetical protein
VSAPAALDHVTVLRTVGNTVVAKRVKRTLDDDWLIAAYDNAFWFSVEEEPVNNLLDLGRLLDRVSHDPQAGIIRGTPKPGINRNRTWRLTYDTIDESGQERKATFDPAARHYIGLDFDNVPLMTWCPDGLARRRAAIERDRLEHGNFHGAMKTEDDGEDYNLAGDGDPAPVDPVRDWGLTCPLVTSTLPVEFRDASAWWQMTSSAGLKPGGIRIRLWYFLDRAVTDEECKRWLAEAPVDRSLFNPVQFHYTARPVFDPPEADPVPIRSGWWWRHTNVVKVPELPAPIEAPRETREPVKWEPVKFQPGRHREAAEACLARGNPTDWERRFCENVVSLAVLTEAQEETLARIVDPMPARARAYADKVLESVRTASAGDRHPTLMAAAVTLYSMANAGYLDEGEVARQLLAAGEAPLSGRERLERCTRINGRRSKNEEAIDWAWARATASPDLPEGFRP